MKYLIMECHMAYAVVLDEDGVSEGRQYGL